MEQKNKSTLFRSVDLSFVEKQLDLSNCFKVEDFPIPEKISIPIEKQNIKADLLIKLGDSVKTGQVIAHFKNNNLPKIVSTVTGKFVAIQKNPDLSYPERTTICAEIETEKQDVWQQLNQDSDFQNSQSGDDWLNLIQSAAIVGMGGAGFPTHIKLKAVKYLIINAVECEPLIYTDLALIRQKARQILIAAETIEKNLSALNPIKSIHFAIKKKNITFTKTLVDEIQSFNDKRSKNNLHPIEFNLLSNNYPSGGEKQIIEQIFNQEISSTQPSIEQGFLCLNVATLNAIYDAVYEKKACVGRLVTLYDKSKNTIKNKWVRIGVKLKDIVKSENLNPDDYFCIIGGAMMGFEVHNLNASVSRITNCIQIVKNSQSIAKQNHEKCIRCGYCADYCPVRLSPQNLYNSVINENESELYKLNLNDCIECGICDYVCPSEIPLVHYFRYAKSDLKIRKEKREFSDLSKERFDFREFRLNRAKEERAKQLEEKRKQIQKNKVKQDLKKDLINQELNEINKNKS